jgi:hypothetical protein
MKVCDDKDDGEGSMKRRNHDPDRGQCEGLSVTPLQTSSQLGFVHLALDKIDAGGVL